MLRLNVGALEDIPGEDGRGVAAAVMRSMTDNELYESASQFLSEDTIKLLGEFNFIQLCLSVWITSEFFTFQPWRTWRSWTGSSSCFRPRSDRETLATSTRVRVVAYSTLLSVIRLAYMTKTLPRMSLFLRKTIPLMKMDSMAMRQISG